MDRNTTEKKAPHRVTLNERRSLTVTGTEDVCSFDENEVLIRLSDSLLSVDGEGLRILSLDTESGEILIEGTVTGLNYLADAGKTGAKKRGLGGLFS